MRPENTIPAFEYAIAAGTDVLELDMAVTKDNVIVVSHDPILHPPVCSGPKLSALIHDLTLEQVKQWDCGSGKSKEFATQQPVPGTRMPTLDEVFQLASKGKFQFNIETKIFPKKASPAQITAVLKNLGISEDSEEGRNAIATFSSIGPEATPSPEEFVKLVLASIRKYHLEDRVMLQSFDYRTLRAMKALAPEIRLSALSSDGKRSFVEMAAEGQAQIISPVFPTVTAEKVREAHAAGLQVIPWTANKPEQWEKLIQARVDAIITDDPAGLIEYLKQRKEH
jgi:glycerophosphoryl diester phosphodiesterase